MTILETKQVCMYFGGLKAVEQVDMQVEKGEIFGVIGPNGAGKTTFFNVCSGNYAATHGDVFLKGEAITGIRPEQIAAKGMARTFQNIKLFNNM
ncbi:ATP-binding cassette domain-containing protein, partial [Enterocloster asparagiformis]